MSHLQLFDRGCQYIHHYSSGKIRLLASFNAKPNILKRNGKLSGSNEKIRKKKIRG